MASTLTIMRKFAFLLLHGLGFGVCGLSLN